MKRLTVMAASISIAAGVLGFFLGTAVSSDRKVIAAARVGATAAPPADDGKLRIIFFGAHPDDSEYTSAGTAMKWARQGHHVKLVSVTNGDIGHWQMAGGPLAIRRTQEVMEVARRTGVTAEVLDLHDGELMPTLENRRLITRLIRGWNADIVVAHRPNDYHPDHRYTSILVQDSAYMVTVPFWCPDTPPMSKNPVFMYSSDRFQQPNPFRADIAVAIDEVMEPTADALLVMESQIHEGGANGNASLFPSDPAARQKRREEVRKRVIGRYAGLADRFRDALVARYGEAKGRQVRYAQAYQVCEYGRQPSKEELNRLFPY